ncbi:MAG: hypothetical protein AB9M60_18275, partial [Leptothrix sp. (in: b-proteobacteria)]
MAAPSGASTDTGSGASWLRRNPNSLDQALSGACQRSPSVWSRRSSAIEDRSVSYTHLRAHETMDEISNAV